VSHTPHRLAITLALLLILAPGAAHAGQSIVEPPRTQESLSDTFYVHHLPSPAHAAALSENNTLIPLGFGVLLIMADYAVFQVGGVALSGYGVLSLGVVFGPSAGYLYGGVPGRGIIGVGVRLALAYAVPLYVAGMQDGWGGDEGILAVLAAASLGLAGAVVSAIWDCATVGSTVSSVNHRRLASVSLELAPRPAPATGAPGLALTLHLRTGASR
jgi:hypothetical protein